MFGTIAQTARDTDYVFTVDTTIEGNTSDTQFQFWTAGTSGIIPTGSIFFEEVGNPSNSGTYNWNGAVVGNSPIITFPSSGTYRLRVPTNINWGRPKHLAQSSYLDRNKIIEINNWGNHVMYFGLNQSFDGALNLDIVCQDTPNFPSSYNLILAFQNCDSLTDPSGSMINWDVSNCTSLKQTFRYADNFNSNLSKWNTSKITSLDQTFRHAKLYNQPMNTQEVVHYGKTYNAWDVSNVTDFQYTFGGTISSTLTQSFNQDIGNWDVSSATRFTAMFTRCTPFNQDISTKVVTVGSQTYTAWDVSNTPNFNYMFHTARRFNQDISNWDMSGATSMLGMFMAANDFNQPIGNWDISNNTSLYYTLYAATSFNQDIGNWDTGKVTNCFQFNLLGVLDCDISSWDTSKITSFDQMFYRNRFFNNGGQPLTSSYQNKHGREYIAWDTSKGTLFRYMFATAVNTTYTSSFTADISNWDMSSATNLTAMVQEARQFNQDISTKQVTVGSGTALERTYNAWDVSNVTNFTQMFRQRAGTGLFNQPIGNWQINTGSAVNMGLMFYNSDGFNQEISQSLQTVGTSSYTAWDVSGVTNMASMFRFNNNFNKDIGNWNVKNVTSFYEMFRDTVSFNQDLSRWDTRSATNLSFMFYNCGFTNDGNKPLTSSYYNPSDRDAYISWDTRNVTNFRYMFGRGIASYSVPVNIDISNWDTSDATNLSYMFYAGSSGLSAFTYDISTKQVTVGSGTALERTYNAWDVSKSTNFTSMFQNQRVFNQPIGNWQINTGSAVDMTYMFNLSTGFNQDISSSIVTVGSKTYRAWDTQKVSTFFGMFEQADSFNKPIYNWDTTGAGSIGRMFLGNGGFNQDISSSLQTRSETGQDYIAWDVKNITNFSQLFTSALVFNKSIQNWNTVSGSNFYAMLNNADAFTQSLATQSVTINGETWDSWDVSNSTSGSVSDHGATLTTMFSGMAKYKGEGLSSWNIESASFDNTFANSSNFTNNYNDILISWAAQNPTYSGSINFGNSKYDGTPGSAASASRSQLETVNGWIITDGGPV